MRARPNRPISDAEVAVVRAALQRASVTSDAGNLLSTITSLRVVDRCDCGCASVDFESDSDERPQPIADGTATTSSGGEVGIIVWGTSSRITGLEIYDRGAGQNGLQLPEVGSIIPWERRAP